MASIINAATSGGLVTTADTSGVLALQTAGTTAVTVDASQRVGIGTASPQRKLSIVGPDGATGQTDGNSRASLFLDNNGANYVSIFTGTSGDGAVFFSDNGSNNGGMVYETTNDALYFKANNAERARIDSSGSLLVGKTSLSTSTNGFQVAVSGTELSVGRSDARCALFNRNGSNGDSVLFLREGSSVGSISVTTTATAYNTSSDYRLKTVIGAVTGQGARIDALEPVEYTWNANGSRTRGFLAHKFQEVYADSVTGEKDAVDADGNPKYQAMQASTSEVIADLVAEIQSLRQRLAAANL